MNSIHKTLSAFIAGFALTLVAAAQTNGSNSSYSRFGLGMLSDQSQGFNRNMGGVAQGLRSGNQVNTLNPASYSAIDSLSFIFDVGMSVQRTNMSQAGVKLHVNNTSIDFVNAGFRLRRHWGMSIGFVPYTNIGYSFSQTQKVGTDDYTLQPITKTSTFTGSGGLHELYAGIGWNAWKGLSIGVNAGYLWGNINHALTTAYAENGTTSASYNAPNSVESAELKTWKANVGIQYQMQLATAERLTLGATVGIGHDIGGEATLVRFISNGDSISKTTNKAYQLPMTYSVGAAWEHKGKWTIAADYSLEKWASCTAPSIQAGATGIDVQYAATTGSYSDRHKINVGAEYVPARFDGSFGKRIHYRAGAFYSTPYLRINGQDGPREFGLTAGVGLPIANRYTNRTLVNLGVQWTHRAPSVDGMITENYFRLNIGVTFNDEWFKKWKFK